MFREILIILRIVSISLIITRHSPKGEFAEPNAALLHKAGWTRISFCRGVWLIWLVAKGIHWALKTRWVTDFPRSASFLWGRRQDHHSIQCPGAVWIGNLSSSHFIVTCIGSQLVPPPGVGPLPRFKQKGPGVVFRGGASCGKRPRGGGNDPLVYFITRGGGWSGRPLPPGGGGVAWDPPT